MSLKIADNNFALPPEVALQKNAILAQSGAGKSNAGVVLFEEMYREGIPCVAIDPKGDWYGVRSMADGKPGLAVPVFGGLHGDVPLDPKGGARIAEIIVEKRLTCVLDVSEFDSKAEQMRFLTDFATAVYRLNELPLHIFCEEADEYLPQYPQREENRCLHAWKKLYKRGRFKGIGCTLISQRSAAVHKDALNQTDNLFAMRVSAPRDRDAVKAWIQDHTESREILATMPNLEDGEAWIYSPQKLNLMERVRFRRRRTLDTGAAPSLQEVTARKPTAAFAEVDIAGLREALALPPSPTGEGCEEFARENHRLRLDLSAALERETLLRVRLDAIRAKLEEPDPAPPTELNRATVVSRNRPPAARFTTATRENVSAPASQSGLPRLASLLLAALVQHGTMPLAQACLIAGYRLSGKAYSAVKQMRADGLIEGENDNLDATALGRERLGDVQKLPKGKKLADWWQTRLGKLEGKLFEVIRTSGPISIQDACEQAEYKLSGKAYSAAKALRGKGIVVGDNSALSLHEKLR